MQKSDTRHWSNVTGVLTVGILLISGIFVSTSEAEDGITFAAQEMCTVATRESSRAEDDTITGSPRTSVFEEVETPAKPTKAPAPVAVVQLLDVQVLP